ncbi:hypothetical protein BDR06DRAFT_984494 [Suillus hirtellus]|nr:hypothetical protein BDR06DRAFT_984494 [Suillus hirtellus]
MSLDRPETDDGNRVTVLRQLVPGEDGYQGHTETTRTATVVLRGATANHRDDLEREIDDGVNVIKSIIKDPRLVPGASTTELGLGKRVEVYGSGMRGLAQHAVKRYATAAFEVIPRTLAENALGGAEGNEHEQEGGEAWGVDIEVKFTSSAERDGTLLALDPLATKQWAIKPAGPKVPQQASNWDED